VNRYDRLLRAAWREDGLLDSKAKAAVSCGPR
jgi:hypothetical protein